MLGFRRVVVCAAILAGACSDDGTIAADGNDTHGTTGASTGDEGPNQSAGVTTASASGDDPSAGETGALTTGVTEGEGTTGPAGEGTTGLGADDSTGASDPSGFETGHDSDDGVTGITTGDSASGSTGSGVGSSGTEDTGAEGECSPNVMCSPGQLCDYPDDDCGTVAWGSCIEKPQFCPEIYAPVCGCDGITYDNECSAQAAGVDIAQPNPCDR